MRKQPLLAVAALGVIAVCGFILYKSLWGGPKINLGPYTALGQVTADETANLLGNKGSVVIVVTDPGAERDPVTDAQIEACKTGLKKNGEITVSATETVKMDPMQRMATGGAIPADQLMKLVEKHPTASAFLLFIAFPPLGDAEAAKLKSTKAKFIVASASVPGYREMLRAGIFDLALVPKIGGGETAGPDPKTAREWFDREYMIATPQTADKLPY